MPSKREVAKARITAIMEEAKRKNPGSSVRVYENADGTIDAEIVVPVERGEQFGEKIRGVEETFRERRIPNTWSSSGLRFEKPSGGRRYKSPFDTHRGMPQVFTNYYRDTPTANATILEIDKSLARTRHRKPVQAIVRLHWNEYGLRPPREHK